MQTNFTPAQLADPEIAVANEILRRCVHCGMCTATCPTFVTLGDELDSPRGRIYLIKDMLESGRDAGAEEALHIDRCLSCLSCVTTCPSGVDYMHLVDHARVHVEKTFNRPLADRLMRAGLAWVLPHPARLRAALLLARPARGLGFLLPGHGMLAKRLRAMLRLAPGAVPRAAPLGRVYQAVGARRARVALLAGCAQQVLAPSINAASIALLNRLGVEVVIPPEAGCCGALVHHMGRHEAALAAARANVAAWMAQVEGEGLDAVLVNTSGCGTVVKDYGFLLRHEDCAAGAAKISSLTQDISEFLMKFYEPVRAAPGLSVAYHAACSLQHGQQVTAQPKTLLRKAGFKVVEPKDAHLCCGSAGTYNLMQPEIASALRRRKLDTLRALGPDVIAAGNIGCLTQLAGDGVPTVHVVELLDWMAGGEKPQALR
ncbi:glycolate oxidase iron-sulfur subunit [Acidocella aquatica]|uniref:Glycolate oxidase iron-sulfur subunit n=1 Tax=Acidocella aquatica TaxID=1922313 RepID=A0ABQ6ABH4_9PROT|nr:glycolate oxidase subunit GlcF [Acidocella aquatica]GLR67942.1 glycolate oxidase iron-sulfur subunit [Acidocella aquatica]